MKRILCLITALALFSGVSFSQDITVRSINILNTTSGVKLNGKDATTSLSASTSTLTFADSTQLDFRKTQFQSITLTDSIVFKVAKNITPGHQIDLRIVGHGSIVCTLGFPAAWKFVGTKPTSIAATKTAILVLRSYGTTDANIVAHYLVEP